MVIFALMLGAIIPLLTAQHNNAMQADTQKKIIDARDALYGFAQANGRLPCPASPVTSTGLEVLASHTQTSTTNCTYVAGALPWATLGMADTDAWGQRFTYRVTAQFARVVPQDQYAAPCTHANMPAEPIYSSFALCSLGDMTILDNVGGNILATQVPAVIISHGKNGAGGYTTTGLQIATGSDTSEIKNQLTNNGTNTASTTFISKPQNDTYDDLVAYVSLPLLMSKMAAVNKLP
jgi:hypothetical protein